MADKDLSRQVASGTAGAGAPDAAEGPRRAKTARKSTKRSVFGKVYLLYVLALVLALAGLYAYVRGVMVEYEAQNPDVWVREAIAHASESDGRIGQFLEEHVFSDVRYGGTLGDPSAMKERFYDVVKALKDGAADRIACAEDPLHAGTETPVVCVTADGEPFLYVQLREKGRETKLGIMSITDWELETALLLAGDGAEMVFEKNAAGADLPSAGLSYAVEIPEGFTLLVNGSPVSEAVPHGESALEEFQYVAPYTDVPSGLKYQLSGLHFQPVLEALTNAGRPAELIRTGPGTYTVSADYEPTQEAEDLIRGIADPLEIGKLWSKFMTDDVPGAYHGFYQVVSGCMLLEGSNLYDLAEAWADSIDITFVSNHTYQPWTGEEVSNYTKYSDTLLSCDVYFEKNLRVAGQDRVDVFHNRMFFVLVDGTWYLADMLAL
ncbi:MAG: hypothetical protein K5981_01110 [Clostridia bacterium]|nr:hypothetical protein [Clostridia bacterium]